MATQATGIEAKQLAEAKVEGGGEEEGAKEEGGGGKEGEGGGEEAKGEEEAGGVKGAESGTPKAPAATGPVSLNPAKADAEARRKKRKKQMLWLIGGLVLLGIIGLTVTAAVLSYTNEPPEKEL